ncbi:MAG: hypothetical protein ACOYT7_01855 [Patescibacteria group bacterium]
MKTIVIHGDYLSASYQRLTRFIDVARERGWQIVNLEATNNFAAELVKSSLFEETPFYILRNVSQLTKKDLGWLQKNLKNRDGTLVIYHEDFLSEALLSLLPQDKKVEEYKLPKLIFAFLDSLYPKNAKKALTLLEEIFKREPPEFVFYLVCRHFRDLYWAKIGKFLPFPAWKVKKLKQNAKDYSLDALKQIISELAELDVKIKTSKADTISSLDLFLATRLE